MTHPADGSRQGKDGNCLESSPNEMMDCILNNVTLFFLKNHFAQLFLRWGKDWILIDLYMHFVLWLYNWNESVFPSVFLNSQ